VACAVEVPLFATLFTFLVKHPPDENSLIPKILGWYHLLAIMFGQYVLLVWNPGPRSGPTPLSNFVYWVSVFAFQVAITTPIVFFILGMINRRREGNTLPVSL
jgi:hypothetical protein